MRQTAKGGKRVATQNGDKKPSGRVVGATRPTGPGPGPSLIIDNDFEMNFQREVNLIMAILLKRVLCG